MILRISCLLTVQGPLIIPFITLTHPYHSVRSERSERYERMVHRVGEVSEVKEHCERVLGTHSSATSPMKGLGSCHSFNSLRVPPHPRYTLLGWRASAQSEWHSRLSSLNPLPLRWRSEE